MKNILLLSVVLSACEIRATPPAIQTAIVEPPVKVVAELPVQEQPPSQGGQINVTCTNTPDDADMLNNAIGNSPTGSEIVIQGACRIDRTIKLLGDRSYRGLSRTGTVSVPTGTENSIPLPRTAIWR